MKVTVLGSGTSTGVPVPGCDCRVCRSDDPLNKRLRTSIYLEFDAGNYAILIDTSPDLRYQALRAGISRVDCVLYTHTHADHIFGLDDLRPFNFKNKGTPIPLYANETSAAELQRIFGYAFAPDPNYQGGAKPELTLSIIEPDQAIQLGSVEVLPLALKHGSLDVLGFRFGSFAYLTDCSYIPEQTRQQLTGLDALIIDGLRERPHKTHFTHQQAVEEIEQIKPAKSYLTHLTHEIDHHEGNAKLKTMTDLHVELAYDGLIIEL